MAGERDEQLPLGFYWYDAIGKKREQFLAWQRANTVVVKVRSSVDHPDEDPPRTWFLFEVLSGGAPFWPPELGFPTRGQKGMSEGDTVSRPDPAPDVLTQAADVFEFGRVSGVAGLLLLVGALYYIGKD